MTICLRMHIDEVVKLHAANGGSNFFLGIAVYVCLRMIFLGEVEDKF